MSDRKARAEERRRDDRTILLRLSGAGAGDRLWRFKPADEAGARACVVLDVSASGVRLLVEPLGEIENGDYVLRILPDRRCIVRLIWSKYDRLPGVEAGFVFAGDAAAVRDFLREGLAAEAASPIAGTLRPRVT